jgi:ferric-dicitrate binding protein FerR (iron transport regulator)
MKDYTRFSANDFVMDDFFQHWVATPDEEATAFWEQWLKDHPEKIKDVEDARSMIRHFRFSQHTLSGDDITSLWNRIKTFDNEGYENRREIRPSVGLWYKVAAAFVACALLIFVYQRWNDSTYMEYHTAYGETKTIVLPDSSTVMLNSNSTLRFPDHWSMETVREVRLEGEAYFSVTHKVNHQPFRVYTGKEVNVEVLGTAFNVYHRVEETKVVLTTGKVTLHLPAQSATPDITMKPGDFIEYKQKSFSKRTVNPAIYTAWTERKLILDHTSLREMVNMLRDNYGVAIAVTDTSLLSQTVSGSMPLTDAENLVSQIALTFQLKVVKQKNGFLMHE